MKIRPVATLITGAGGFIGSHLAEDQLARGREVVALDLKEGFLQEVLPQPSLTFLQGDILDQALIAKALRGIDIVFHLASAHLDVRLSPQHYEEVNVQGVRLLLEESRRAGVRRFVHCSSVGVHGDLKTVPGQEESPFAPTNLYERTKVAGEQEALRFYRETKFPLVIVRPAWVFGPRCERTQKLLRTISRGRFLMIGSGQNWRHPVYIKDMLEAFELAAQKPAAVGEIFIIGGEHPIQTKEFIQTFCEVTGSPYPKIQIPLPAARGAAVVIEKAFGLLGQEPPVSRRTLAFFTNNNAFDISKAKRLLSYAPQHDLKSGLQEILQTLAPARGR